MAVDPSIAARLLAAAQRCPGLRLLVLHGSRARGEAHSGSDWDFAVLGDAHLDRTALAVALADAVGTDAVDVADLERSSAVLRWHVARDGAVLFEDASQPWFDFRRDAVDFWCDAGGIIREAQQAFLAALGPAPVAEGSQP